MIIGQSFEPCLIVELMHESRSTNSTTNTKPKFAIHARDVMDDVRKRYMNKCPYMLRTPIIISDIVYPPYSSSNHLFLGTPKEKGEMEIETKNM